MARTKVKVLLVARATMGYNECLQFWIDSFVFLNPNNFSTVIYQARDNSDLTALNTV